MAIGIIAGLMLAAAFWVVAMLSDGHRIADVIQGLVEDGLGMLQGFAALGTLCGTIVGLSSGIWALGNAE